MYQTAAMLVSALACVASDGVKPATFDPVRPSADVELENRTGQSLLITLYYNNYDASVDCAAVLAGEFSSLTPKQFDSGTLCSQFEDGAISSCGSIDLSPPPDASFHPMCKSLAIRAPGLPDTILIWPTQTAPSTKPDQGHLYLETSGNGLVINGTDYVQSIPPPFPLPAPTCDAGQ